MWRNAFSSTTPPIYTIFEFSGNDYECKDLQRNLDPDADALLTHCRWLLDQGVDGLAVFGTTSEANSLSLEERIGLLEHLLENGIPAEKLMPGTGMCALSDTVRLTQHAVEHGCRGVLMLPPFYYKAINDDGLFASYAEVYSASVMPRCAFISTTFRPLRRSVCRSNSSGGCSPPIPTRSSGSRTAPAIGITPQPCYVNILR